MTGTSVGPWFKALVILVALGVGEIGYIAYRSSRPNALEMLREEARNEEAKEELIYELSFLSLGQGLHKMGRRGDSPGHYTGSVDSVFHESPSNIELDILEATDSTWRARARHKKADVVCFATEATEFEGTRSATAECEIG